MLGQFQVRGVQLTPRLLWWRGWYHAPPPREDERENDKQIASQFYGNLAVFYDIICVLQLSAYIGLPNYDMVNPFTCRNAAFHQ